MKLILSETDLKQLIAATFDVEDDDVELVFSNAGNQLASVDLGPIVEED